MELLLLLLMMMMHTKKKEGKEESCGESRRRRGEVWIFFAFSLCNSPSKRQTTAKVHSGTHKFSNFRNSLATALATTRDGTKISTTITTAPSD